MSGFEYLQKDMDENPGEYHQWEIQNNPKFFSRFRDLQRDMSWRDQKQQVERPELSFITQDEIDAVLRKGGITLVVVTVFMNISWNIMIQKKLRIS